MQPRRIRPCRLPKPELPRRDPQAARPAAIEVNAAEEKLNVQVPAPQPAGERRQPGRMAQPAEVNDVVVVAVKAPPETKDQNPLGAQVQLGRRQEVAPAPAAAAVNRVALSPPAARPSTPDFPPAAVPDEAPRMHPWRRVQAGRCRDLPCRPRHPSILTRRAPPALNPPARSRSPAPW